MAERQDASLGTNEPLMEGETATDHIEGVTEERLAELRRALGAEVRRLRNGKQWTLKRLAKRTQLTDGFLSGLEIGNSGGSIETYACLAKTLGVTLPQLMSVLDPFCTTTEKPLERPAATLIEKIAIRLRQQRIKLGLKVATLEQRSGISMETIYRIEEGGKSNVYTIYGLAAANQMTLAELFAVLDDHVEPETK